MTTTQRSQVARVPPADPALAHAHFLARLAFETDPSEVHEDQRDRVAAFVVVDARGRDAYDEGHVPGARSIPFREVDPTAVAALPEGLVVTYGWGPGCNAGTQVAAAIAALGRPVKEMMGGWEHWLQEGYPVQRDR